jgi:hypothetical protein
MPIQLRKMRRLEYCWLWGVVGGLLIFCSFVQAANGVADIVTLDPEPSYSQRHAILHSLSVARLASDSQVLIEFMRAEQVPQEMDEVEYMALVNDIYNLLLANGTEVQQLFDICLEVIPNEVAGKIWRDYCMQKLAYTIGRDDLEPESIQKALGLLDSATRGEYPKMQGTALVVAMQHLAHPFDPQPEFLNSQTLGQRALKAAKDDGRPLIDRITALQIAAECRASGALGYATALILDDGQVEPMLRVVAVACLGQLGDQSHIPMLEEYRLSPDIRVRTAVRSAINNLKDES